MSITCFLAFSGCNRDKEDERIGVIVGKNWKLTAATEDGEDVYLEYYPACERDNIGKYFSDGTYQEDEGPTKCSPNDDQIFQTLKWKFNGDKLVLSEEGFSIEFTIVTLTRSTLKYQTRIDGSDYIFTFTAQ